MRQIPSQNEGIDSPSAATTDTARSTHVSCQYAATRPSVTPSTTAMRNAARVRVRLTGRRSRIAVVTGRPR